MWRWHLKLSSTPLWPNSILSSALVIRTAIKCLSLHLALPQCAQTTLHLIWAWNRVSEGCKWSCRSSLYIAQTAKGQNKFFSALLTPYVFIKFKKIMPLKSHSHISCISTIFYLPRSHCEDRCKDSDLPWPLTF